MYIYIYMYIYMYSSHRLPSSAIREASLWLKGCLVKILSEKVHLACLISFHQVKNEVVHHKRTSASMYTGMPG